MSMDALNNQGADLLQSLHQLPCHSKNARNNRQGCRKSSCKTRAVSKNDRGEYFTA